MQTYLPSPDFNECAECLDNKRLRNQANECYMIARAVIFGPDEPCGKHCVCEMWRFIGLSLLVSYWECIANKCVERNLNGFKAPSHEFVENYGTHVSNLSHVFRANHTMAIGSPPKPLRLPWDFYERYQSHLLSKDKIHYTESLKPIVTRMGTLPVPASGYIAIHRKSGEWREYSLPKQPKTL